MKNIFLTGVFSISYIFGKYMLQQRAELLLLLLLLLLLSLLLLIYLFIYLFYRFLYVPDLFYSKF